MKQASLKSYDYFIKPIEFFPTYIQQAQHTRLYNKNIDVKSEFYLLHNLGYNTKSDKYKVLLDFYNPETNEFYKEWREKNKINSTICDTVGTVKYTSKSLKNQIIQSQKAHIRKILPKKHKNFKQVFSLLSEEDRNYAFKTYQTDTALPLRKNLNVMPLDIDCHDDNYYFTKKAFEKLYKTLDYPELLVEQSLRNRGLHVFIPLNIEIEKQTINEFLNILNKELREEFISEGYDIAKNKQFIECPPFLRRINSSCYQVCDTPTIESLQDLIVHQQTSYLIESKDILERFNSLEKTSISYLYKYINNNTEQEQFIKQEEQVLPLFQRNNNTSKSNIKKLYDNISIGKGYRFIPSKSLASYGKMLGLSAEQVASDIRCKDSGSIDLKKMSQQELTQNIQNLFDFFDRTKNDNYTKYTKKETTCFLSNKDIVPNKIKNNLNPLIQKIISDLNYSYCKKEKYYSIIKDLTLEVIGQFIYDSTNKKSIIDNNISLTEDNIVGTSFSNKWISLYKKYKQIESNNIDIKRIIKCILSYSLFKQQFYIINNKKVEYLFKNYKACKSYIINSDNIIETIISYIKDKFNKYNFLLKGKIKLLSKNYYNKIYVKNNSLITIDKTQFLIDTG